MFSPCAEALELVNGPRQDHYGHPADNIGATAATWSIYLNRRFRTSHIQLTVRDVCWMMADLKKLRDANAAKNDNLVDTCGYMEAAAMAANRFCEDAITEIQKALVAACENQGVPAADVAITPPAAYVDSDGQTVAAFSVDRPAFGGRCFRHGAWWEEKQSERTGIRYLECGQGACHARITSAAESGA